MVWKRISGLEIKPVQIISANEFFITHKNGVEDRHSDVCDWFPSRKQAIKFKIRQLKQNVITLTQQLQDAKQLLDNFKDEHNVKR